MRIEKTELEFIGCVRDLARAGRFEGAGLGIAKQVINSGQSSLNERQRLIFHAALDKLIIEKCPGCGRAIPWGEMAAVISKGACLNCSAVKPV